MQLMFGQIEKLILVSFCDRNFCPFSGPVEGAADVDLIAAAVEDNVFQEFKNTEMKYKNRVRSRIANIKVRV